MTPLLWCGDTVVALCCVSVSPTPAGHRSCSSSECFLCTLRAVWFCRDTDWWFCFGQGSMEGEDSLLWGSLIWRSATHFYQPLNVLVGSVGRMVMNSISDRFILFSPHSDAASWEEQSCLKKKRQNQFVLQYLKITVVLILSVKNTECKLGCVGVEGNACCTHQFCFICLSSSLCSFFFAENPLGNLCLHSVQYEEILSYCKGASRYDSRNGNKFHISGAEVLISRITAPSNAAFNK